MKIENIAKLNVARKITPMIIDTIPIPASQFLPNIESNLNDLD